MADASHCHRRILAAVVTHNRRELLQRCIDSLENQVRRPDQIIVVNNGSTDGTEAMLQERGIPCITQDNVGSAGGWHRAIEYALAGGFDAVWLMDDDGYADRRALAELEARLSDGIACASSIVVREQQPSHFVFPFPILDRRGLPALFRFPRKISTVTALRRLCPQGTYSFAHFFNGALIATGAVRKIGNVNRDYFIFGEEVDYLFRLRKAGGVQSVLTAVHFHPDVRKRPYTAAKVYYYIKNTLILNRRHFDWVPMRDVATVVAAVGRLAARNGLQEALSFLMGRNARIFYRAISFGLHGRLGKDFVG